MIDPLDIRDHWADRIRGVILAAIAAGVSVEFCHDGDGDSLSLVAYDHPESSFGVVIYEESEESD